MLGYTNVLPTPQNNDIAQILRGHMTSGLNGSKDTVVAGGGKPLKGGGGFHIILVLVPNASPNKNCSTASNLFIAGEIRSGYIQDQFTISY